VFLYGCMGPWAHMGLGPRAHMGPFVSAFNNLRFNEAIFGLLYKRILDRIPVLTKLAVPWAHGSIRVHAPYGPMDHYCDTYVSKANMGPWALYGPKSFIGPRALYGPGPPRSRVYGAHGPMGLGP